MTTYESDIKTISSNEEVVFNILSDLNNLQKIKEKFPENDVVSGMQFDSDRCSFQAPVVGKISFRITSREPNKQIALTLENSPMEANAWIYLAPISQDETELKLALSADLPPMVKMMADKKIKEGINVLAEKLAEALSV